MDRLEQLVKNKVLMEKLAADTNKETLLRIEDIKTQIATRERDIRGWEEKLTDMADIQRLQAELRQTEATQVNTDELAVVIARCQGMMEAVPASLKRDLLKLIVSEATLSPEKFTIGIMCEQRWTAIPGPVLAKGTRSTVKSNTPVLIDWRVVLAPRGGFEPPTN